jgi:hypothetical protein
VVFLIVWPEVRRDSVFRFLYPLSPDPVTVFPLTKDVERPWVSTSKPSSLPRPVTILMYPIPLSLFLSSFPF